MPKGPFRTKKTIVLESEEFCYGRGLLLSVPFSCMPFKFFIWGGGGNLAEMSAGTLRDFSDPQNKGSEISGKFRSIFHELSDPTKIPPISRDRCSNTPVALCFL